jgi:hypothetical protein
LSERPETEIEHVVRFLTGRVADWITAQRTRYRRAAHPLSPDQRGGLARFFEEPTVERVRVLRVPSIEDPPWHGDVPGHKWDLREMSGITYQDVVLINDEFVPHPAPLGLLFHEMVHVAQYQLLGVEEFARQYVRGWATNGFSYLSIPLEKEAYALEAAFNRGVLDGRTVELRLRLARTPGADGRIV